MSGTAVKDDDFEINLNTITVNKDAGHHGVSICFRKLANREIIILLR
jgi:hypothetical protein